MSRNTPSKKSRKKKLAPELPTIDTPEPEAMIKTYPPGHQPKAQPEYSDYNPDPNQPHEYTKHPSPRAIGDLCICGKYLQDQIHISAGAAIEERMEQVDQPVRTAAEIAMGEQLNPALARMKAMAKLVDDGAGKAITGLKMAGADIESGKGWGSIMKLQPSESPRVLIVDQAIELCALFPDDHPYRIAILEAAAEEFIRTIFPMIIATPNEAAGA